MVSCRQAWRRRRLRRRRARPRRRAGRRRSRRRPKSRWRREKSLRSASASAGKIGPEGDGGHRLSSHGRPVLAVLDGDAEAASGPALVSSRQPRSRIRRRPGALRRVLRLRQVGHAIHEAARWRREAIDSIHPFISATIERRHLRWRCKNRVRRGRREAMAGVLESFEAEESRRFVAQAAGRFWPSVVGVRPRMWKRVQMRDRGRRVEVVGQRLDIAASERRRRAPARRDDRLRRSAAAPFRSPRSPRTVQSIGWR